MGKKLYYTAKGTPYYLSTDETPTTPEEVERIRRIFSGTPVAIARVSPRARDGGQEPRSRPADPEPADKPSRKEPF